MAASKASITFGLVYIPVKLELATKKEEIAFHQLHKKTKQRIRYYKSCDDCERNVDMKDIVKAYQYDDNKYIILSDEDFEKVKSEKDRSIHIESFINVKDIDPIYYDKSYYVHPDKSDKPFELLRTAMASANKVAIAKVVLSNKENLVALRVKDNVMVMSILYFEEDIVSPPIYKNIKIEKKELDLANLLINQMSNIIKLEDFKDEYKIRLKKVIDAKIKGKKITFEGEDHKDEGLDLMAALKKSIKPNTRPRA